MLYNTKNSKKIIQKQRDFFSSFLKLSERNKFSLSYGNVEHYKFSPIIDHVTSVNYSFVQFI